MHKSATSQNNPGPTEVKSDLVWLALVERKLVTV